MIGLLGACELIGVTLIGLKMSELPYRDTKPVGAPDFYFANNATFRYILDRFGKDGWIRWLQDLARDFFSPVNQNWKEGGLDAVAEYWKAFFKAEPGADVTVIRSEDRVLVAVKTCPAIAHLKSAQRDIVSCFCEHCYYMNNARANAADMSMSVVGGNGRCVQTYAMGNSLKQDLWQIEEVR